MERQNEEEGMNDHLYRNMISSEMTKVRSQGGMSLGVDGIILVFFSPPNPTLA